MKTPTLSEMSDDELQAHITACAEKLLAARTPDERNEWWNKECEALRERARRPEVVRAMEKERGLA